jgi:hypothetical protein
VQSRFCYSNFPIIVTFKVALSSKICYNKTFQEAMVLSDAGDVSLGCFYGYHVGFNDDKRIKMKIKT